jgi:hypothetical protein
MYVYPQVTPDCLKAKAEEAKAFAEKNMPKVPGIKSITVHTLFYLSIAVYSIST